MPRALAYRVQTRQPGEPWRTVRTWGNQPGAEEDARDLAALGIVIRGYRITVPRHPFVRVMCGGEVVLELTGRPLRTSDAAEAC